jgi:DNA polymerase-1
VEEDASYEAQGFFNHNCSSPNIQNLPKAPGVRECYIPRPGWAFCSVDYEALELHTLAEVCLELLGHSALADALNEGLDPHLLLACEWLLADCPYEQGVEIRKDENHPRYKEVKEARNLAKAANFGLPGGLGAQRFCDFCKASGIIVSLDQSKDLKQAWLRQWPEMRQYFGLISSMLDTDEEGLEGVTLEQIYSARVRGKARYTSACNSYFQGLAADGAKDAVYEIVKATFTPGHILYGSRLVAFIHDETIMEHPMLSREDLDARAKEQARIMLVSMEKFCRRVKPKAKPALMLRWYKDAIDHYDEDGFLIPWKPKQELVWN